MTTPRVRTGLTTLVTVLLLTACQAPQGSHGNGAVPDDAISRLHHAARVEAETPPQAPESVALPPGVDPDALRRRVTPESRMSVARVFADHLGTTAETPPEPLPEADAEVASEVRRLALYHYARARQAALDGKHLIAITELQKCLEQDPDSVRVIRELARSYAALGSISQSIRLFDEVLSREPGDSEALLAIAIASVDRREFQRAVGAIAARWDDDAQRLRFDHDHGANTVAWYVLTHALQQLDHDRASIDAASQVVLLIGSLPGGSIYGPRLDVVYRQRGALWRSMGDASCRLGEYDAALAAYAYAATLPTPDPGALNPRVIYASLSSGHRLAAQVELLEALRVGRDRVSDREISLCRYLAEHAAPVDLLGEAVASIYDEQRDRADLARATAALLPRAEALAILREYLDRAPEDVEVASQFLAWLGEDDLPAAVSLTAALSADHPHLAGTYAAHLAVGPPTLTALIEAAGTLPADPATAGLEIRLLLLADSPGRAWERIGDATRVWSRNPELLRLQIEVAAALGETLLVDEAVREAAGINTEAVDLAEARAWLALNMVDRAIAAAQWSINTHGESYDALLVLAAAQAAHAISATNEAELAQRAPAIVSTAERAIAMDPDRDDAYAVLFDVYRQGSPMANAEALVKLARRLLEHAPESRMYARLAARESIGQGRFEQALDRLLNLYESDPTDRASLGLAVTAWVQMNRMDDALQWLENRLADHPADPVLLEQWAALLAQVPSRPDEIVNGLQVAWELDPDNMAISTLLEQALTGADRIDESLQLGEARLMQRPPGVRRSLGLAATFARGERTAEAVEQLRSILTYGKGDPGLDYLISALTIAGTLDPADEDRQQVTLDIAERAIERYPDRAPLQVYGSALVALARLGRLDERLDELAQLAVLQAPGAGDGTLTAAMQWRHLAQMMVDAEQSEAAARTVRARIYAVNRLDPDALSLLTLVALAADAATGGRADSSISLLRDLDSRGQLPRVDGGTQSASLVDTLFEVSTIYSIADDESGADQLLRAVLDLDADHAMAMNNLGYLRLESGASGADPEVEALINRAFTLEPEDSNVIDTLGWLRYKQRKFEDETADPVEDGGAPIVYPGALTLIQDAIDRSIQPSGEVFEHLGDTFYRLGDVDAARKAWQRAILSLDDPARQQQTLRVLLLIQRGWGLLLEDPRALYDRDEGAVLKRVKEKVEALNAGAEPAVAPTFDELNGGT